MAEYCPSNYCVGTILAIHTVLQLFQDAKIPPCWVPKVGMYVCKYVCTCASIPDVRLTVSRSQRNWVWHLDAYPEPQLPVPPQYKQTPSAAAAFARSVRAASHSHLNHNPLVVVNLPHPPRLRKIHTHDVANYSITYLAKILAKYTSYNDLYTETVTNIPVRGPLLDRVTCPPNQPASQSGCNQGTQYSLREADLDDRTTSGSNQGFPRCSIKSNIMRRMA